MASGIGVGRGGGGREEEGGDIGGGVGGEAIGVEALLILCAPVQRGYARKHRP